jgi:site-specific DNA recombinase
MARVNQNGTPRIAASDHLRAGLYDRVSTQRQKERGFSQDAQFKDTQDYADKLGADVVARWSDVDSVADWDLPGLNALLKAARNREIDLVVCYDPDRFARSMTKQLVVEEELRRYGVPLQFARFKLEDTAEGRLLKNQLSSFAEYEREKIRMRTMRGKREKVERGLVVGDSVPPFGYRYVRNTLDKIIGLEPDPVTAPIIARIFRLAATHGTDQIAIMLNAERLRAPQGGRWHGSSIFRMLISTVYVGILPYGTGRNRGRLGPDATDFTRIAVPSLIDRTTWDAAQRGLHDRRSARCGRTPRESDPYTLRGMATCNHCGRAISVGRLVGARYYICLRTQSHHRRNSGWAPCDLPLIPAVELEEYAWQVVCDALLDRKNLAEGLAAARAQFAYADGQRQQHIAIIDAEIKQQRGQLDKVGAQLLRAHADSDLEEMWQRHAQEINARLRALRAERATLDVMKPEGLSPEDVLTLETFADEVRQGMGNAHAPQRRQIFELLRLRLIIGDDPGGAPLGRKHRFGVSWEALIPLTQSGEQVLTCWMRIVTYLWNKRDLQPSASLDHR